MSRGVIRTAVAELLPECTTADQGIPGPELAVVLDMPGEVAGFLRATELEPAERAALDQGVTVRGGQGYTLRVSTGPEVHRQLLDRCQPLGNATAIPATVQGPARVRNPRQRARGRQLESHAVKASDSNTGLWSVPTGPPACSAPCGPRPCSPATTLAGEGARRPNRAPRETAAQREAGALSTSGGYDMRDTYRDAPEEVISVKSGTGTLPAASGKEAPPASVEVVDLMAMLEKSVQ
ncbi:hypothetical protein [Streptomyces sp. NPDC020817]|uniref:hypothetical protein n=1 Tax=Streptomyces sp. NPDC020817 TaxID=3365095 RepID=UPI0037AC7965